jgi:hypothetical protein
MFSPKEERTLVKVFLPFAELEELVAVTLLPPLEVPPHPTRSNGVKSATIKKPFFITEIIIKTTPLRFNEERNDFAGKKPRRDALASESKK